MRSGPQPLWATTRVRGGALEHGGDGVDAVENRHREVQQDDVGLQALGRADGGHTVGCLPHDLDSGVLLQRVAHEGPEGLDVVAHQYPDRRHRGRG